MSDHIPDRDCITLGCHDIILYRSDEASMLCVDDINLSENILAVSLWNRYFVVASYDGFIKVSLRRQAAKIQLIHQQHVDVYVKSYYAIDIY